MVTPKSEDGLLSDEEIMESSAGFPPGTIPGGESISGNYFDEFQRVAKAQRDLTASIKDASCQARVERIYEGLRKCAISRQDIMMFKVADDKYVKVPHYIISEDDFQDLKKQEGI